MIAECSVTLENKTKSELILFIEELQNMLEEKDKEMEFQKDINKIEKDRHKKTEKSLKGQIIKQNKIIEKLEKEAQKYFEEIIKQDREMDFMNAGSICVGHETIVVELLENMFKDKDIISGWIYEQNYGRDFSLGDLEADGVKIDLTTPEKLYDYLIKQMERE